MTGPQMVVKQLLNWLGCRIEPEQVDALFAKLEKEAPATLAAIQDVKGNFEKLVTAVAAIDYQVQVLKAQTQAMNAQLMDFIKEERAERGRRTNSHGDSSGTGDRNGGEFPFAPRRHW